ncbi:ATP-dependent helicase [Synechococcus sp. CCY9201]|uniref:ATP-dependent helicase n=1 Tax=unclassified Synechococcus TaxID=2626047 RepID=UPI002AD4F139|nr:MULTISPECIES: ATP-dependent helicase [unclassified Synechococcus]MEA5422314.1 ATP-dependent helicase [Synechococcus sp. CCY9202]MEA5475341.1 ATP-dependent helicase [Synechococcus sp. CCY9201]CAK6699090.1 RecBCD enzyme subunit RecD [Synechococcus sp. CBW1107]
MSRASRSSAAAAPADNGEGLTADQHQALTAFATWLEAPADGTPFVLQGFAGTGKTFLSMRFLALAEAACLCWTVVAPTHKAVGVLRHHLQRQGLQPTWYPSTIHRLLRLKLRRERDLERCEETEQTAAALESLGLVLVDEASMVDGTLLEITLRCAHPFRTRLVFVGDPAQLPPVGEPSSPVFAIGRAQGAALQQVVRHQGPVLRLAEGVRLGALPCRQPPPLRPLCSPQGQVALLDRRAWLTAAQAALQGSAATADPDQVRILCYTNRRLEQLVPIARRALHGSMADQLPVLPGEVLISRTAVMAPACREGAEAAEEPDMVLGSNRELVVQDVQPERCDLRDFGVEEAPLIDTLTAAVEAGETQLQLRLLPPIGSSGRGALEAVLTKLRQEAREAGRKGGKALWRRFFLVRDAFASLGPAAVLTVHRSQGSTFGEVFVDGDVFWPQDERLRRQLVYVAVSRAAESVSLAAGPGNPAEQEQWRRWLEGG